MHLLGRRKELTKTEEFQRLFEPRRFLTGYQESPETAMHQFPMGILLLGQIKSRTMTAASPQGKDG